MRVPDPPKRVERHPVLPVSKNLGHAGALRGIVRLQGNSHLTAQRPCFPQIAQNGQNSVPVLQVSEDLGHAGGLRGIVRFTGKQAFDPTEPQRVPDPPKRAERDPF